MNTIKLADIDYMPDESHSAYVLCWADGPHGAGFEWFSTEAELATAKPPEGEQTYTFFITVPFNDSLTEAINGCFHDHIQAHQWEQKHPEQAQAETQHEQTTLQRLEQIEGLAEGATAMKTCIELTDLAFPVKVEQAANGGFRVTYGQEVHRDLTYREAAKQFGLCVFHALACDAKLDNGE